MVDGKFLNYFLRSDIGTFQVKNLVKGIHLYPKDVGRIKIPLPPLPIQRKIAEVLDRADAVRQRQRQIIAHYDQLAQSVFLNMFGDFIEDSVNLEGKRQLSSISEITSGVTKNSKLKSDDVVEVPYMRVANVQDGYIDLTEVKVIKTKRADVEKYQLVFGDILLTEGGDPDKLGRGAVWEGQIENCIHQNHIFRVRPDKSLILPQFLSALIGSKYGKKYFLRSREANNWNCNHQ